MTNKEFIIKLRDARNKLLGRTKLIEQFEAAHRIVIKAISKLPRGEFSTKMHKAYDDVFETVYYKDEYGDIQSESGFNQYEARRKTLKKKIEAMQQIMKQLELNR